MRIAKRMKTLFLRFELFYKPHQLVTPSTQNEEFRFYLHLFRSCRLSKVKGVNFIVIHDVGKKFDFIFICLEAAA